MEKAIVDHWIPDQNFNQLVLALLAGINGMYCGANGRVRICMQGTGTKCAIGACWRTLAHAGVHER